jgi:uncharacterized repeat protein (TIGR03837 family)
MGALLCALRRLGLHSGGCYNMPPFMHGSHGDGHPMLWDVFCRVIDNHGDLGVSWRLARQLHAAGQRVRLWVDDARALTWMAPAPSAPQADGSISGISVLPWHRAEQASGLSDMPPADVWIEAFGCEMPTAFVQHAAQNRAQPPVWVNLEYLSAEPYVARMHALPSPVMHGPARGWIKHFFYPGFTPGTGGLLREQDLLQRQAAFDRPAWRQGHGVGHDQRAVSLFCYEPPALAQLLAHAASDGSHLLVTPGRPLEAVQAALCHTAHAPASTALPYTTQDTFDHLLWACDLNCVRGEDSLVRALWAGQPLVWHIYPQDDQAHHAKLDAFLDWLDAPASLRRYHHIWNGMLDAPLPSVGDAELQTWRACVQTARARLLAQDDLLTQLFAHVQAQPGAGTFHPNSLSNSHST